MRHLQLKKYKPRRTLRNAKKKGDTHSRNTLRSSLSSFSLRSLCPLRLIKVTIVGIKNFRWIPAFEGIKKREGSALCAICS